MRRWIHVAVCFAVATAAPVFSGQAQEKKPPKITYDEHVQPILRAKCFSCHNADESNGDLDLTNYTNLMQGGGSGTVVEPGDSSGSYLYKLVAHIEEPYMPPEQPKLPDEMIETIRKWIDGGLLENATSKALVSDKPKFDLALKTSPTEKPATPPMPAKLVLEPATRTKDTTAVSALATNPWSPVVAVAGQKQVLLYHTERLELLGVLPFPEGVPQVLKFSRNGSLLLAGGGRGGATGLAVIWNLKTGERVFEIGDELDAVLAADISADQTLVALGGPQRVVRIYSTETGRLLHELRKHTDWITSLEFSPDSVLLATGDRNGGLFVWEAWTGREYLTLKGHTAQITGVSWRLDSNLLASCSEDTSIKLWEMENGATVKTWNAHSGGTSYVEFARDGRIFSCGRDRMTRMWDQNGAKQRDFEQFGDLALRVTHCDETNRAIAGDWTGEIRVWNAADGKRLGVLTPNPPKLNERLDAAKAELVAKQAAHKPLADAYNQAQTTLDKAKAQMAQLQQKVNEATQRSQTANATFETAKQTVTTSTAAMQAAAKDVAKLDGGVPALAEAAAKAQAAAAKFPEDKKLADAATSLQGLATARKTELESNRERLSQCEAALDKAKQDLTTAQKNATTATTNLKTATDQLGKLAPTIKPMEEKRTATKQQADAAMGAVTTAQNVVDRWTHEISFVEKMNSLNSQRQEVLDKLNEQRQKQATAAEQAALSQAAATKAESAAKAAQAAQAATTKEHQVAMTTASNARKQQSGAEAAHQAATKAAADLQRTLALLTAGLPKLNEAVTQAKGDKELADTVAKLASVAEARKTSLAAMQKDVTEKTRAVDVAKQAVVAADKAVAEKAVAMQAAVKQAATLATALKAAQQKAVADKPAVEAANQAVAAVQKELKQVEAQIASARGL